MFVQVIRGKVSDPDAVRALADRWKQELAPSATGWLGSTSGITDDDELFVLVRFESEDAARANSDKPEQGAWWAAMEKALDGEATFQDSNDVWVESSGGDPDAARFVQVMTGQTRDPARSRELVSNSQPAMRALRPDILGSVTVGHDEGKWTMVVYFASEEEAREGERKDIPQELQKELQSTMEEMMSLAVGQPEYLDLKRPSMDSPE